MRARIAIAVSALAILAGCGSTDSSTPVACLEGTAPYLVALKSAPGVVELKGETVYIGKPEYRKYDTAPIKLQMHGDPSPPISFRNIWVRELQ